MAVNPIPHGYSSVTPALVVDGAEELIAFMTTAFGAEELMQMPRDDGKVMHAEVRIGDTKLMVGDTMPEFPAVQHASLHLYVDDVDTVYQRAIDAGATAMMAPMPMFYGDRTAAVIDAWGIRWSIATHIEDVSEEEMMRRLAESYQLPAPG
jgi:PhnB protein